MAGDAVPIHFYMHVYFNDCIYVECRVFNLYIIAMLIIFLILDKRQGSIEFFLTLMILCLSVV